MTMYRFGRFLLRCLFEVYGGVERVHEERLPRTGPVIVAPNHVSFADPPLVGCGTARPLFFMAKRELFVPVFGPILHSVNTFPVDRGTVDLGAIRHALGLLSEGKALLVFPEGTRGDGRTLGLPNQGVAMLAKRSGAQVVPVGVVGSGKFLGRGSKLMHRSHMIVIWGEPFTYAEVCGDLPEKAARERFARELMGRIRALVAERGPAPALPWDAAEATASENAKR
jgi:1-acyl-sn-glycerol-3-phosphate acyltransferase